MMDWVRIKARNKEDLKIIIDLAWHLGAEVYIEESPYDPEFVAKILESKEQAEQGKRMKVNVDELWK